MRLSPLVFFPLLLAACAPEPEPPAPEAARESAEAAAPVVPGEAFEAVAVLEGEVNGSVRFTQVDGGVRVLALVDGLPGSDLHALAVHEGGACEAPGGHFDPGGTLHGSPYADSTARHAGDLGNLESDDGSARYDRIDPLLQLDGPRSIVGRTLVVHAGQDDANTLPDGGAGTALACGIIEGSR